MALRFFPILAAAFGLLVAFAWLSGLGRKGQAAGFISLMACSAGLYLITYQLRAYGVLFPLFFGALWAVERFRQSGRRKYFWLAAVATNLAIATHYGYVFPAFAVVGYAFFRLYSNHPKSTLLKGALAATLPGIALVIFDLIRKSAPEASPFWYVSKPLPYFWRFRYDKTVWTLPGYLFECWRGHARMWVQGAEVPGALLLTVTLFSILGWAVCRWRRGDREPAAWLSIFATPLALAWFAALFNLYPYGPIRQAFFILILGSVLLTLPLSKVSEEKAPAVLLLLLPLALGVVLYRMPGGIFWVVFVAGAVALAIPVGRLHLRFLLATVGLFLLVRNPDSAPARKLYGGHLNERVEARIVENIIQKNTALPRTKVFTEPTLFPLSYYNEGLPAGLGKVYGRDLSLGLPNTLRKLPLTRLPRHLPTILDAIQGCTQQPSAQDDRCVFVLWRVWDVFPYESLPSTFTNQASVRVIKLKNWFVVEVTRPQTRLPTL